MQIVIDIPEELKNDFETENWTVLACAKMKNALHQSIPLLKGKWMPSDVPNSVLSKCSNCGFDTGAWSFNYCPKCGAKMEVEK